MSKVLAATWEARDEEIHSGVGEAHSTAEAGSCRSREGASLQGAFKAIEDEEIGRGPANSRTDPDITAEALREGEAGSTCVSLT